MNATTTHTHTHTHAHAHATTHTHTTTRTTMKAIVQQRYGSTDMLDYADIAVPTPGPNDILVRVHAAGVDAGTWHLMTGKPYLMRLMGFGFRGPKARVRGLAFAGRVDAVGSAVTRFRPGDDVFGAAESAFAEYLVTPESNAVPMPVGLGFEKAAALPISGTTALQAVRDAAEVSPGQRVLVLGAAGGVGCFAVQLAVAAGASVTGVCSGPKTELVRSLGADRVIDYTSTDVTALDEKWDVIIDTAGNRSLSKLRGILTSTGTLVIVGGERGGPTLGGIERVLAAGIVNAFTGQRLRGLMSKENPADQAALADRVDHGVLDPVIDTVYPLSDAASAISHIAAGRARGKVILSI